MGKRIVMVNTCKACGGTYETTLADGSRYFHACSPISNPAYQPDPASAAYNTQLTVERPNKRDENVTLSADGKTEVPISIGAGVETI